MIPKQLGEKAIVVLLGSGHLVTSRQQPKMQVVPLVIRLVAVEQKRHFDTTYVAASSADQLVTFGDTTEGR